MADGLALIGFVKSSRRIVNVGTASIVAAMNRLRKRATRCFYPVCCGSHRNFVDGTFRGIWHADLLRTEENRNAAYHELPAIPMTPHPPQHLTACSKTPFNCNLN